MSWIFEWKCEEINVCMLRAEGVVVVPFHGISFRVHNRANTPEVVGDEIERFRRAVFTNLDDTPVKNYACQLVSVPVFLKYQRTRIRPAVPFFPCLFQFRPVRQVGVVRFNLLSVSRFREQI